MKRAAAAIALIASLFAAPAHAAFPGENGLIAFEQQDYNPSTQENGWDILVKPAFSQSAGTNLTNSPGINDMDPAWNASGQLIAFVSDRNGDLDLYLMRPDGTDVRQLTSGAVVRHPTWSPDDSKIAVESRNPDGTYGIWVVTVNGSEPVKPLLPFGGGQPAWSPDGSRIAFVSNPLGPQQPQRYLHVMNADGSDDRQISDLVATHPDWSPDGREIAVSAYAPTDLDWEIYAVRSDGSGARKVLNNQSPYGAFDLEPSWSPDGTKIASHLDTWVDYPRDGFVNLHFLEVFSASGSGPSQSVATGPDARPADPAWQRVGEGLDPFTRSYARPGSASPMQVPLVPAYRDCASPNGRHVAPLDVASCSPSVLESVGLKMSSVGRGRGMVRLRAIAGDPNTAADEADLGVTAIVTDVVCSGMPTRGCGGAGSDYSGDLLFTMGFRLTDFGNPFEDVAATAEDVPNGSYRALRIPFSCRPTAGPRGGSCKLNSTADAFLPGLAREGGRKVLSILGIEILDFGRDGVLNPYGTPCPPDCAGTGDEKRFLVQGVFTP